MIILIIWLSYFYLFQVLMAQEGNLTAGKIDFLTKKPVICECVDPFSLNDPHITPLKPECMPCECDILVLADFEIDNKSKIIVNEEFIKRLAGPKPVILSVLRSYGYMDWVQVLNPDGNKEEVKILVEFAKAHPNVIGYRVIQTAPKMYGSDSLSIDIGKFIIPYLKGLKYKEDFIVSLSVDPYGPILKNPCIYDFVELNKVVDYFEINTFNMNDCLPKISNAYDPLKIREHGPSFLMTMEEVTKFLLESKIQVEKLYYVIGITPFDSAGEQDFYSYADVCTTSDLTEWCVDNTKDFFNKGSYAKEQKAGISIRFPILDDPYDLCGCGPFIATRNILAGFHAKESIPCPKIDVKKTL